jgi:hypothetical protein
MWGEQRREGKDNRIRDGEGKEGRRAEMGKRRRMGKITVRLYLYF